MESADDGMPAAPRLSRGSVIPLWFKIVYLAFVAVLVPVYTWNYGLLHLLWFSDVALIGGLLAAWLESRRLASMMVVSVTLFELIWIVDFLSGVPLDGETLMGLVDYMFDEEIPPFLRALSLFHLWLPFALFWLTWRLGYERKAWLLWLIMGWGILVVSFFVATPEQNVNWVLGPGDKLQEWLPAWAWLGVVMGVAAVAWWLTHKVFEWLMVHFNRFA